MSDADVSDITGQLNTLLSEIIKYNDYLNTKSWYFPGDQTFLWIHGQSDTSEVFYDDTMGIYCKYDQLEKDDISPIMYYDPRYSIEYVKNYNQLYFNYAICHYSDNTYGVVDLASSANVIVNYDLNTDMLVEALELYAAATVMDKKNVLINNGVSQSTLDKLLSTDERKTIYNQHVSELKSKLGVKEAFVSYKASVEELGLWYLTSDNVEHVEEMVEVYKEAIDKLYDIAKTAAENGGTIINCINSAATNIVGNKYSYINISQIMVCINNETKVDADENDTTLDELYNRIIDAQTKEATNEATVKIVKIALIVNVVIIALTFFSMLVCSVYSNIRIAILDAKNKGENESKE